MKSLLVHSKSTWSIFAFIVLFVVFGFSNRDNEAGSAFSEMPVGSIIIWAGETPPVGWEICRGQRKSKNANAELYTSIGGYWNKDEGANSDFFQLPDLRGVFVRGVNGSRDDGYKDTGSRSSVTGLPQFNYTVGSFQSDAFEKHDHGGGNHDHGGGNHNHGLRVWDKDNIKNNRASAAYIGNVQRGVANTEYSGRIIKNSGKIIDDEGLSETRPKNAYVHYIIKVN